MLSSMKLASLVFLWLIIFGTLFKTSLNIIFQKNNVKAETSSMEFYTLPVNENFSIESSPDEDIRIKVLERFLADYNSPLTHYSEELVKQADLWGLDYALLPSIALQESGGCKKIPENSYNCWGYGIYGKNVIMFSSYEQAIAQVAKTIKEAYIKRGYTNPTLLEAKWTSSDSGQWSYGVNFFIGKIKEYERNSPAS